MGQLTRRVLVTASREWTDRARIYDALDEQLQIAYEAGQRMVLIHGAARGGDTMAHHWYAATKAVFEDLDEEQYPVTRQEWRTSGKKAGVLRNQVMVEAGADICLAFPLPGSRGTLDCMERARAAGIEVKDLGSRDLGEVVVDP